MEAILKLIDTTECTYPNNAKEISIFTRLTDKIVIAHMIYQELIDRCLPSDDPLNQAIIHQYSIQPDIWIGESNMLIDSLGKYIKGKEILVYRKPEMTINQCLDNGYYELIDTHKVQAILNEYKGKAGVYIGSSKLFEEAAQAKLSKLHNCEHIVEYMVDGYYQTNK